jgi:hypothetical protein
MYEEIDSFGLMRGKKGFIAFYEATVIRFTVAMCRP